MAEHPRSWLASHAAIIVGHLREAGFDEESGVLRQVLNLAEEAGEAVGAYRRAAGHARRMGAWQDFWQEVGDVVVTAYVLAEEAGFDLDEAIHDKLQVIYSRGWREDARRDPSIAPSDDEQARARRIARQVQAGGTCACGDPNSPGNHRYPWEGDCSECILHEATAIRPVGRASDG